MQPVRKDLFCDLAIIGGGVGGCTAAICAARRGLHVIMFEKGVSLGGLATNGYVPQIAGGIEGICMEYTKRLDDIGQLRKVDPSKDYYRNPSFEPEFGKFVLEIDKCSFGIYLIHMIFVRGILKHTKIHPYGAGSPFVLISLTLGIFFVSFILTWLLKKIPGVKKIL